MAYNAFKVAWTIYIYIYSLGGSRYGLYKTCRNLLLTFLIGGLWHGAAWTFVLWGAMHGIALVVHRIWKESGRRMHRLTAWLCTFLFVNFAWIIFRAKDFASVGKFLDAFTFQSGWGLSEQFESMLRTSTFFSSKTVVILCIFLLLALTVCSKNSTALLEKFHKNSVFVFSLLMFCFSLFLLSLPERSTEFIYFQF